MNNTVCKNLKKQTKQNLQSMKRDSYRHLIKTSNMFWLYEIFRLFFFFPILNIGDPLCNFWVRDFHVQTFQWIPFLGKKEGPKPDHVSPGRRLSGRWVGKGTERARAAARYEPPFGMGHAWVVASCPSLPLHALLHSLSFSCSSISSS